MSSTHRRSALHDSAVLGVTALALTVGVGLLAMRSSPAPVARTVAGVDAPPAPRGAPADWCTKGYEAIPGACLAMPEGSSRRSLVIYLHGRYAKDHVAEETDRQRRIAARLTSKGYAVLALRGQLGGCGNPELADWYCWPSNERTADGADDTVAAWKEALEETERRVRPDHRFVLGFSNGGYFASLLASRGMVKADAFVVAHGGPVKPFDARDGSSPFLLISADDDVAQDDMLRLDAELTKVRWPHDSYARGGAHGLTDQDIDAALTFFGRVTEPLPLNPPIAGLHRPSHHPHEVVPVLPGAPEDDAGSPVETAAQAPNDTPTDDETIDDPSSAN